MNVSLSVFAPGNLVPRDGFGSRSRVSLLISILRLNLVLAYGIPPEFRGGVHYLFKTATRHRFSPAFIGPHSCVPMAFTAESPPT